MDKDWNVKVCDFGLSTAVERGKMWEDEVRFTNRSPRDLFFFCVY